MDKIKVTKKSIREKYPKIIRVGYCNIAYLLRYKKPFAYSSGINGWSCDYYNIDGVIISTGYNPIGNIESNYKVMEIYNGYAKTYVSKNEFKEQYEKMENYLIYLLHDFITKTIKGEYNNEEGE